MALALVTACHEPAEEFPSPTVEQLTADATGAGLPLAEAHAMASIHVLGLLDLALVLVDWLADERGSDHAAVLQQLGVKLASEAGG